MLKIKSIIGYLMVWASVLCLFSAGSLIAQSIDIDRLNPKLEIEIHRMMSEGRIPSAAVSLVFEDQIFWTRAYGYSNLWARTHAVPSTVYLIGSTFSALWR